MYTAKCRSTLPDYPWVRQDLAAARPVNQRVPRLPSAYVHSCESVPRVAELTQVIQSMRRSITPPAKVRRGPSIAIRKSAHVNTDIVFHIEGSFRLEEIGKIDREPVALPRVTVDRRLDTREPHASLDPDGPVHPEHARTEELLLRAGAGHREILSLQRAGTLARKLAKYTPIPARVVGAPRE